VASDEPDDAVGVGDGRTTNDVQGAEPGSPDFRLHLRAERDGAGDGRTYALAYTATDAAGNASSAGSTVAVPHDRDGEVDPIHVMLRRDPSGATIQWRPVVGARRHDVVRGHLEDIAETESSFDLGEVACVGQLSPGESVLAWTDADVPEAGRALFYLVQYAGSEASSYGSETAAKPRTVSGGDCE
jgi:hypothetical protein